MSPVDALMYGIRKALLENELTRPQVISTDMISGTDPLPAALISVHADTPQYTFGPTEAWRDVKVSVEWLAEDAGGLGADDITDPVNEATREMLVLSVSDEEAQVRFNRLLEPKGYSVGIPMECGSILPYTKPVGKDKTDFRRARGYFYDFRISRL